MRVFEYSQQQILHVLLRIPHESTDAWVKLFMGYHEAWYQLQLCNGFDGKLLQNFQESSPQACLWPSATSSALEILRPSHGASVLARFVDEDGDGVVKSVEHGQASLGVGNVCNNISFLTAWKSCSGRNSPRTVLRTPESVHLRKYFLTHSYRTVYHSRCW